MNVYKRVHYSGRVQGVGFRYTAQGLAADYAVAGYVRNLANGDVELVVVLGGGVALAAQFTLLQTPSTLESSGRLYGSLLHLQLSVDLLVGVFTVLLLLWPKGAAVALAAFREGVRQPMFWYILAAAI